MKRLAIVACALALTASAHAVAASQNSGLAISPLRSYPTQDPGTTTSNSIALYNQSDKPLAVSLDTEMFRTINENYDYSFSPVGNQSWIKFASGQLNLGARSSQQVAYQIAVPASVKPGGYYYVITATTSQPASNKNFTELKRVGSLIYLNVSGQIVKNVKMVGVDLPWFSISTHPTLAARLANSGSTHELVSVVINAKSLPLKAPSQPNINGFVLPGTVRKMTKQLNLGFWPGIYTIDSQFSSTVSPVSHQTHHLIYLPIWLVAFLVCASLYGLWRRYLKRA